MILMKKYKKSTKKKTYRKPIMKQQDKKTVGSSLKYITLIFLLAGFLFENRPLMGVGLIVLVVFFMMEKH
ncbi:hypothetical protein CEE44_04010 [Candidatus Woesearchaeota archaeon B3_Woes]|nr:MAG: hypothetical protein CEE44_04010 [Candidatus Woesearchaeota archaeon B3_Woes]